MPDSKSKIPCYECKAVGEPKFFSKITNWHLTNAHKELYPDLKTALKKYKQKFPEAPIICDGFYDFHKANKAEKKVAEKTKPPEKITDMSEVDQAGWSRNEAHRKYYELEERLKKTDDPDEYRDLVSLQQRFWKEASPPRSAIEGKKGIRTITKKEQAEVDKNIKFLESIKDRLDSVTSIDPDVAKFFSPV